ncbi:MAG: HIT domain-containing protein [Chloroflexi bacterium]|nr:HIT domain-containing protein [Chloroflexota bacterium]MBI3763756.1 HIT domain-containing protein [Chloroflexota bacterium]
MEHLWTPWRMTYLMGEGGKLEGCIFCDKPAGDDDENFILHRGQQSFIMLNLYPYNNGHLMIAPYAHEPSIESLDAATLAEMMALSQRSLRLLRRAYDPQAFNLGLNIGAAAGAGVADHVHLHIVPRWAGDTSFMSTLAETRVIPEWVGRTYERLKAIWPEVE